ncbi:MAG: acyl-CoA dehydrogenase family protein [Myxococcales bacterium]|nr:acyl-CoA dehydrogenase family protein [Myxococcales bacterium]
MQLNLTAAQTETRDAAAAAARVLLAPAAAELDATERFPGETLQKLGRNGLLGVNIAREHGGRGAGVAAYALAVRELAGACAGTTVGMMVTNMVAEAIQRFGDAAQKAHYLPRITGGVWPAAGFSLSEPGSGSDAASLRTRAVRDGDHYVLDGTKAWVTSGGHAGVYLVMASTDPAARARGISAFLVDADTPGLSAARPEEKMGLHASTTTQLVLEGARVPESRRLGPEGIGFKIAMSSLDGGRIGVSAQACGVATHALRLAREHLQAVAEDPPVDFPEKQRLLADCVVELDAGWLLCLRAAALKDAGASLVREAAMAKLYCTEMAHRVCQRALRIIGADGFTRGHAAEQLLRDVRVMRIYEGTSEVQRIVIAREVLRGVA